MPGRDCLGNQSYSRSGEGMGAEGRPGAARKVLEVRARTVGRYTPNRNHRMQEPDRAPCAVPLPRSGLTLSLYALGMALGLTAAERPRPRGQSVRGTPPCTNGTWFGIGVRKLKSQTGNREFGTANAVSRGYRGASVPAASRAGDATGLVRCAGTMSRAGRRPAAGLLVTCVSRAARAPAAESALRGTVRVDVRRRERSY